VVFAKLGAIGTAKRARHGEGGTCRPLRRSIRPRTTRSPARAVERESATERVRLISRSAARPARPARTITRPRNARGRVSRNGRLGGPKAMLARPRGRAVGRGRPPPPPLPLRPRHNNRDRSIGEIKMTGIVFDVNVGRITCDESL